MRKRYLVLALLASLIAVAGVTFLSVKQNDSNAMSVGAEFRDISLAMQNRISSYGNLPPAVRWSSLDPSTPLNSWRFDVSAFLEGFSYPGGDYQSSWDSASNSQLHNMPTSLALSYRLDGNPQNYAKVYAVTGTDTAFGISANDSTSWSPEELPPDTIIAIEVARSKKHWMQPGDYRLATIRDDIVSGDGEFLNGNVSGRFHVIFADFEVWALSTKTPFENVEFFLTKSSASEHDRDELLKPYCVATCNGGG